MKCPACGIEMLVQDFGDAKVEVCANGCQGIWDNRNALAILDQTDTGFGRFLEEALKKPRENEHPRGTLICPKCRLPMHTHPYKGVRDVNVDECYKCGGVFLDPGELRAVRQGLERLAAWQPGWNFREGFRGRPDFPGRNPADQSSPTTPAHAF